ncbi:MAG: family N-acetyltransferase [Bacillales bacterium]|nr:family N-acetyltransferase [Bacillales bacterium]
MKLRFVIASDYDTILAQINEWWGGRQMSDMLPMLFFEHFNNTSFIAEKDGEVTGFLIGFLSQSNPDEAYIHFVGVHPKYRKQKIGKVLYEEFFKISRQNGRSIIRCVTSPVNKDSINFHMKMGFSIEKGNKMTDSISVFQDYDGPNQDRVVFKKKLDRSTL